MQADASRLGAIGSCEQAEAALTEISTHVQLLDKQIGDNQTRFEQLLRQTDRLQADVDDLRTTQTTILEHDRIRQRLVDLEVQRSADLQDPFDARDRLQTVADDVARVEAMLQADRNSHAEAARAIEGAASELETALRFVQQSREDQIPDSALTTRCVREIEQLEQTLDQAKRRLEVPHDDWEEVDERAARLNAELATQSGTLRGELQLAQQSVSELERASRQVFAATRWTGGLGVNILGSPGSNELQRARDALRGGNYQAMIQLSRAAATAAQFAIEQAQREIERRRREQRRREEEQRRAAAARRRRMSQSSSFGSRIGSSSSSIGSRSRSSRSPSGSGFSRSGW